MMKKLTNREKFSLALVAVVAVVAFIFLFFKVILPSWRQVSSDIVTKQERLNVAQKLVEFETTGMNLTDSLRQKTGLQGSSVISGELLKTLQDQFTVDDDDEDKLNINRVGKLQLTKIDGVDNGIADSILAYRKKIGRFERLEQLKEIRKSIFEDENSQAVIFQRLSQVAHQNGIGKIARSEPKLLISKKKKTLSNNAQKNLINEIYLSELNAERKALKKMESEDEKATGEPNIVGNREFPTLPPEIPVKLRLQVAKDILAQKGDVKQKSVELEGATAAEAEDESLAALNAKEDEVYVKVLDKGKKGFLGIMAKPALVRVSLREDEQGIIAAFRQSIADYNQEIADAIWEEEESKLYDEYEYGDEGGFDDDDYLSDYDEDSESEEKGPNESEGEKKETDTKNDSDEIKPSGEEISDEKEEPSTEENTPDIEQDDTSKEQDEKNKQESTVEEDDTDVEGDSDETKSSGKQVNDEKEEPSVEEEDTSEIKQDDTSEEKEEEAEDKLERTQINEDVMIEKLVDYLVQVSDTKYQLRGWLSAKSMPSQYLKQNYVVEMHFNCNLDNLVKFINSVESQLKWIYVRGLKISKSEQKSGKDENKSLLNADITFVATIM